MMLLVVVACQRYITFMKRRVDRGSARHCGVAPTTRALLLAVAFLASGFAPAAAQELIPWTGGATAPIDLEDPAGRRHRLSDYRGKVVLVNFWATWCAPCREEMPSIERLRRSLEGEPFAVLAVNVGEDARAVRSFTEQVRVAFPLLLDRDTSVTRGWRVRVLPATFLVGPDGRIRFSYLGELDWSKDSVRSKIVGLMQKEPRTTAGASR